MVGDREDEHLLDFLWTELQSRGVVAQESPNNWGPSFDWCIRRDEYGFIIDFPSERFENVASWVAGIFGSPKFNCDAGPGPTKIHRDDDACVTIMLSSNPKEAQLVLLHWKDPSVRKQINAKRDAAMVKGLDNAVRDACEAVQCAVNSVGSAGNDDRWQEASSKLSELKSALGVVISGDEAKNIE